MAILQISKIQQRSGNLVDLPQLDDAEFGWATDAKRLFIGKTTPNENIEILTSYSKINFSQLNGTVGNLNISNVTIADGQLLTYNGSDWVNRGGDAGGLITLGDASNVKITGGAIGYVLETDGLGNLSWTPKSTIISYLENVTKANPAVVTTAQDNFFTQGAAITITDVPGMTQLNGNQYYVDIISANTFALYSDSGLTTPVNSTGYTAFSYSTVSATSTLTDEITVADSSVFSLNDPVVFAGNLGNSTIVVGETYYIKTKPSGTKITISATAGGPTFDPGTEASPTNARVYVPGGRAVSLVTGGGSTSLAAAGTTTQIQYNDTNLLQGNADFTYNNSTKLLNLNGNANIGNLNTTGVVTTTQLISNVATGTAPLTVTSTTRVANLNVSYANVSDFGVVSAAGGGTYYPVFVGGNTSGNYALASNAVLSFNASTGTLNTGILSVTGNVTSGNVYANSGTVGASLLTGTLTTAAQPNITSVGTLTSVAITGNAVAGNMYANTGTIGALRLSGEGGNISNIQGANVSGTVATANVANNITVITQTSGNAFLLFANAVTGTVSESANAAFVANTSNGALYATTFIGTLSGAATTAGTVTTAAQPNITSVGTLTGLTVSGSVSFTSTSSSALLVGGYAQIPGAASAVGIKFTGGGTLYGLAMQPVTDGTNMMTFFNAAGSAVGSITQTASNITWNGLVTGSNVTGAVAFATTANSVAGANVSGTVSSATTAGTVTTAAQPNITSVGSLTSLTVSGALTTTQITAGANTTAGNITGNWTLTSGSRLQATYADLAEYYEADEAYEPGTVLMFGGEREVTIAEDGTNRVAGVVSTNPAYLMNNDCPGNKVALALQGRVPVKVRGKIQKGDMIISGGNGFARPEKFPSIGTVIGKALEDFDGYEGVIEVAVGRL